MVTYAGKVCSKSTSVNLFAPSGLELKDMNRKEVCNRFEAYKMHSNNDDTRYARICRTQKVGDGVDPEFEMLRKDRKDLKGIEKSGQFVNQYNANTKRKRQRGCDGELLLCKLARHKTGDMDGFTEDWDLKPVAELILNFSYELIFIFLAIGLILIRTLNIVLQRIDRVLEAYSQLDSIEGGERETYRKSYQKEHQECQEEDRIEKKKIRIPNQELNCLFDTPKPILRTREHQDRGTQTMSTPDSSESGNSLLKSVEMSKLLMCRTPMPLPGSEGMPLFDGTNVTEFLDRYDDTCNEHFVEGDDKLNKLPRYCTPNIRDAIKSMKEWKLKDYSILRKAMLLEYKEYDSYQQIYSLQFLEKYKSVIRTSKDDIRQYYRRFDMIAKVLMSRGVLAKYTASIWFIQGLPQEMAAKVMRKQEIDTEDPATVDYDKILEHVESATKSEKAIQRMNSERSPTSDQKTELKELLTRFQTTTIAPKERKPADPVTMTSTPATTSAMDRKMDQLVQAFDKLTVNMGTFVQQSQQQYLPRYPGSPQVSSTQQPEGNDTQTMGVNGMRAGARAGIDLKGNCFYCWNRIPEYPQHRFRDQCPTFLKHVAAGTVHINQNGRLCIGPMREGARELWLRRDSPQGDQVRMQTAGTEYDENIDKRPKKEVSQPASTPVNGLTFVVSDSEDEDEEEIEGYGEVNVVSVADANGARVQEPKTQEKWKNPMKIMKRKVENEKKYATTKAPRSGTWEPATATEVPDDMEIEDLPVEPEMVSSEVQTEKKQWTRKPAIPRKKFMDHLKERANTEDLLDEIMDQKISIRLRDIITSSDSLMKLMFRGIPKKISDEMPVAKVGNVAIKRSYREYAAKTPKIRVKIGDVVVDAMLDTGAEVNVMTKALADKAGLTVRTNLLLSLKTVSGEMRKFDGACEDVDVTIGGLTNVQTIMVIDDIEHKLILGQPFFHDAQLTFEYDEEGYQCAKFMNEERTKTGITRVCPPQGKAWRKARVENEMSENE